MIVNMLLSVPARFYALPKLGCKDTGTKDTVPDALTFNTKFYYIVLFQVSVGHGCHIQWGV